MVFGVGVGVLVAGEKQIMESRWKGRGTRLVKDWAHVISLSHGLELMGFHFF